MLFFQRSSDDDGHYKTDATSLETRLGFGNSKYLELNKRIDG